MKQAFHILMFLQKRQLWHTEVKKYVQVYTASK